MSHWALRGGLLYDDDDGGPRYPAVYSQHINIPPIVNVHDGVVGRKILLVEYCGGISTVSSTCCLLGVA